MRRTRDRVSRLCRSLLWRVGGFFVLSAAFHAGIAWGVDAAGPSVDLTHLSLQELAHLEVTSVSKTSEALQRASASIYVITHEAIVRSGATSLMEALRIAPNLRITQVSSSSYVISSRGFAGNPVAQSFSNKLLMLIDGRSVYTPLFSGIYSDAQDVMLEDIDRIEVISGPGATLWGANAMNGVINVITRPSYLTQGSVADLAAGNREQDTSVRYGGKYGGEVAYRVYGLGFHRASERLADGSTAEDGWTKGQGGFRLDWSGDKDSATLQGDLYRATEQQLGSSDGSIFGANVVGRYQHQSERSELQVQGYFDQTQRFGPTGGAGFVLHTYDIEVQQTLQVGTRQRIVWGAGERLNSYGITNAPPGGATQLLFLPPHRELALGNVFVQDSVTIGQGVSLTGGLKMEDDPYWGWTPLPDARLSWALSERATLWAAAARAIRSPTPFDDDVVEKLGTAVFLAANHGFRPERVTAYETGVRIDAAPAISFSLSTFYNDYDNLRTIEPAPDGQFLPLYWGNFMKGETYGLQGWANWQLVGWWRLSPGFTVLHEQLRFKPGASGILGVTQTTDDPSARVELTSSMELKHRVSFDTSLRYVGALPSPGLSHYYEMNARLGWRASDSFDLSLNGLNLLHPRHYEFAPSQGGEAIGRSVLAEGRWRF
jgi:iron complex outermembrane receptor protein